MFLFSFLFLRKKNIDAIKKMTAMTQDEIVSNTKTVIQGLEALKNENHSILNWLLSSLRAIQGETQNGDSKVTLMEEKAVIIQKSIESIELGLGEAQVSNQASLVNMRHQGNEFR